ncbi:MAG: 2OG-Fe(II) oxygenase family protein [Pseudomonadota bacterium]
MEVPLIDCDSNTREDSEIAVDIDRALSDVGFMALQNLGLRQSIVEKAFAVSRHFFAEPSATKARCAYGLAAENFGYQGLLEESLDPAKPADLKETFTMRNLTAAGIASERWPSEKFRDEMVIFYGDVLGAAQRLQRLLARALETPADFFVSRHNGENVTLRLLHYPPVNGARVDAEQMGAGAHTDYGMLTLLFQDNVGGLQVQSTSGAWHDVPPRPETIVINAGDLLERWSNGRYRSTVHRVLPRVPSGDRFSIALFVDPDSDTMVEALSSCVDEENPPRYPKTTAGEHLQEKILATH